MPLCRRAGGESLAEDLIARPFAPGNASNDSPGAARCHELIVMAPGDLLAVDITSYLLLQLV